MAELAEYLHGKNMIVIFGYAHFGKKIYDFIHQRRNEQAICFCDNSSIKKSQRGNICIFSVEEAVDRYRDQIFLIASLYHAKSMHDQLKLMGVSENCIVTDLPDELVQSEQKWEELERQTQSTKIHLEININKHCNLDCQGCDHFAPLSDADFMDMKILAKDLHRLSAFMQDRIDLVHLLGGEPLLNPEIKQCMAMVREAFPIARIIIDTNGILLQDMDEEFWNACRQYEVEIAVTKYPIKIDYTKLADGIKNKGVQFSYVGSSESGRTLWHFPLDLTGGQNPRESFIHCRNANQCITLENGRLYTCSIAPNIKAFNDYFHQHVELTEADGIDIYQAKSASEILEAMAKPMPFCRYCDVKHRTYDHPWEVSKKDIREWTL